MERVRVPRQSRDPIGGRWTPWLILAGAVTLTLAATLFVWRSARARNDALFTSAVRSAQDRISGRLEIYVAMLRGGAAYFWASDMVRATEFRAYVERLNLERNYPGMQGMGWTRRLAWMPGAEVDERHTIEYLEPMDARNRAALGYDMYSEPTRREAMRRARDLGEPALSGKVRLVQEIYGPEQAGMLLYVPVYATGEIPATLEERRTRLLGFVYGAFRAGDLFTGIFGSETHPLVGFQVYDGSISPESLLHASRYPPGHEPAHTAVVPVEVAGRDLTLVFRSQPSFEAGSTGGSVTLVLLGGLVASLLLFGLARGQARARAAAESANQAKSTFLATMSHELRTPLNAIGGYVDLMRHGIPEPVSPVHLEHLERIQRAQRHLRALIDDVLDFARLETGRLASTKETVPVSGVVEEAEAMVAPGVGTRGLTYERVGGPDVALMGDAEKVRQVLVNLLSNAVKFTEPGGRVWTSWTSEDGWVRISVSDTGIGIAPEDAEAIFAPFNQVDSHLTRVRQGTGLGLAISRSLAQVMGGTIEVDSEPGRGSRFVLTLPAAP